MSATYVVTQPTPEKSRKEHTKQQSSIKCRRGGSCEFKAKGNCFFSHQVNEKQVTKRNANSKDNKSNRSRGSKENFWCKYQDKCFNPKCEFKHFETNFIEKPAPTVKPTLAMWLAKA